MTESGDLAEVHTQHSPYHEKNWMPVVVREGEERLRFVYSTDPCIVLTFEMGSKLTNPRPGDVKPSGVLRGGSPLAPFKDGYIAVVHEVSGAKPREGAYSHRFVTFDSQLNRRQIGRPFYFQHKGIEFCCGLAKMSDDVYCASYGVDDKRAFACEVATATIEDMLR